MCLVPRCHQKINLSLALTGTRCWVMERTSQRCCALIAFTSDTPRPRCTAIATTSSSSPPPWRLPPAAAGVEKTLFPCCFIPLSSISSAWVSASLASSFASRPSTYDDFEVGGAEEVIARSMRAPVLPSPEARVACCVVASAVSNARKNLCRKACSPPGLKNRKSGFFFANSFFSPKFAGAKRSQTHRALQLAAAFARRGHRDRRRMNTCQSE